MPAHAGDEANHPHRDGRTSGDEDDGGKDDGATSTGGGEEKNAFAKRGMAGHGEREAWGGGCLGHVVEGEGVGFGVGSAFEQVGVAGILALREKGAAHPPDGGVEPMKDAGDLGEEGHPKAATLDVAEFDRAGDAELGECFGEKGGGLRGDSILSPTVHGEEITEAAKGEEEEKGERARDLFDELANFGNLGFGELLVVGIEQGGDEVFGFAFEEGAKEALERATLGFLGGDRRTIEIASPFFRMFYHVLIFERGEEGPHGGIGRGIGKLVLDILCGGFTQTIENIEDLALAAGESPFFETVHMAKISCAGKTAMEMLENQHRMMAIEFG